MNWKKTGRTTGDNGESTTYYESDMIINRLEQYEDTEPKTGEWREHIFDGIMGGRPRAMMCTRCNYISLCAYNYCPHCGADMREGEQG